MKEEKVIYEKCQHINCDNIILGSRSNKKFCCRSCKEKYHKHRKTEGYKKVIDNKVKLGIIEYVKEFKQSQESKKYTGKDKD